MKAVAGNGQVLVSWKAPASNGGAPITGYTAVSAPGNKTCTASASALQCTVTGLTNGTAYTFKVTASNRAGKSVPSAASSAATPATKPGAPTSVKAVAGNGQVLVSWKAPASTGGAPITAYTAVSSPGNKTCTASGSALQCTVTGLTNGTAYTFKVTATNRAGKSAPSAASSAATPATKPGAPTSVNAVAGNGQATVSWKAPASTGGAPITAYTAVSSPGNKTCTASGSALQCTVTGLTNGTAYTFKVTATNRAGNSAPSAASPAVTPRAPVTVPGAPTDLAAVAADAKVTLSWKAPASNGGAPITKYTVTSAPGAKTCTTSGALTCTVTGLTNGTAYTFSVVATNSAGNGAQALVGPVTPQAAAAVPGAPTAVTSRAGDARATVSWKAPTSNGGAPITKYTVTSTPGGKTCSTSIGLTCTVLGLTNGTTYTFKVTATNRAGTGAASAASASVKPSASPRQVEVAAGKMHTCAVLLDKTVQCWGSNYLGQLGDGTDAYASPLPVTVKGITNALAVDAGEVHSCALLEDGSVRCWGFNAAGQLGNGTNEMSNVPVTVEGITNAIAITTGDYHSCALLNDATIRCWGSNYHGALGDADTFGDNSNVPVQVAEIANAMTVSGGFAHTCAVLTDGGVKCWGKNANGQLGDGTSSETHVPVSVLGITTAQSVAAGGIHSCALLEDGSAKCWGNNSFGELGDGQGGTPGAGSLVPVDVEDLADATALSAGSGHSCAVLSDGGSRCWGTNTFGQLGNGTTENSNVPVQVSDLAKALSVAAGGDHSCAVVFGGQIKCWGLNWDGQLGDGPDGTYTGQSEVPVDVVGLGGEAVTPPA